MIYHAPIVDFIHKGTFVMDDVYPGFTDNLSCISGYGYRPTAAGEKIYFRGLIRPAIFTLLSINIVFQAYAARADMRMAVLIFAGALGGFFGIKNYSQYHEHLGAVVANKIAEFDVYPLLASITNDDYFYIQCSHSSATDATELDLMEVVVKYSMA